MREGPVEQTKLKTWSALSAQRRKPSEYEAVAFDVHFLNDYAQPGKPGPALPSLDPDAYINRWYKKNLLESPLRHDDWLAFRDPEEVTYRRYNIIQEGQENYVAEIMDRFSNEAHDTGLDGEWQTVLSRLYTPGRFLHHTVQMVSAYAATATPASTISHCYAFQAADALRAVSHISYRTVELARSHAGAGFNEDERGHWEKSPEWQGFRELMEKVLVVYEFGETFAALNLVAKPAIDEACVRQLGRAARRFDDSVLDLLADAILKDTARSRAWTAALVKFLGKEPANLDHLRAWIAKWEPLADRAIDAFCAGLPEGDRAAAAARQATRDFRASLGL
ncbi:toluene monooxygenase [Zavarzinia compransoris]|uniref:Toluene monooxygenase n=1 Tax=Zavarzinia compransoris TaxID=1264899 RepID=A0A317DU03_9PROT|nr:toluene monooxygenase [Zavarzinia compransoris]PWR17854.1 toluene monooxygenase [Zavarzinia compransoris]TDP49390.1 toluene monooxygenase system protein E [Zavarzinia compransoris]